MENWVGEGFVELVFSLSAETRLPKINSVHFSTHEKCQIEMQIPQTARDKGRAAKRTLDHTF